VQHFKGWQHVSIGALLRQEITSQTTKVLSCSYCTYKHSSHGIICQQYIDDGQIVPLEIVLSKEPSIKPLKRVQGVLKEALDSSNEVNFLIDGYPRVPNQIKAFEDSVHF